MARRRMVEIGRTDAGEEGAKILTMLAISVPPRGRLRDLSVGDAHSSTFSSRLIVHFVVRVPSYPVPGIRSMNAEGGKLPHDVRCKKDKKKRKKKKKPGSW